MQRHITAICIAIATLAAAPAFAGPHSHETRAPSQEAHGTRDGLTLDNGRKWSSDAALRQHMGDIRDMLSRESQAILAGKLTDEQARALGMHIQVKAAAIITDCNLPPAADANLHLIVADLLEAAEILRGKTGMRPQQGTGKAVRATQMYATYFDHPGWQPVH